MKKISLRIMSLLYIAAGVNHFIHPEFYRKIMPPWVPLQEEMILVSGIAEVVLGFLLLFPFSRRVAAWGIIALLIAVFPANIQMMLNYYHENKPGLWFTVLRLPLQILLIAWAYSFTKPLTQNK
jgi:uncharacterized membrane protein